MRKIIISIFSIVLTVGAVTGAAYALFSSTANVQGITISTGNAGLKIFNGTAYVDNWVFPGGLENLSPGETRTFIWELKNDSASAINLGITGRISSYSGDWLPLNTINLEALGNGVTPSLPLVDWNTAPVSLGTLGQGITAAYVVTFAVPGSAGNEMSGKSLTNVNFALVGTQLP